MRAVPSHPARKSRSCRRLRKVTILVTESYEKNLLGTARFRPKISAQRVAFPLQAIGTNGAARPPTGAILIGLLDLLELHSGS